MTNKEKIKGMLQDLGDYVQYAVEALERNDFEELESNLSMVCDDAGIALAIAEHLNNQ